MLTSDDLLQERAPSGSADLRPNPQIRLLPGDVVVPAIAPSLVARVVGNESALLGRGLQLLRCDPQAIDPWFLAGYLRTSANERQVGSVSGSQRFDLRRAHVPRIPLDEQRRHGALFRQLRRFDEVVRTAGTLAAELSRNTADGLAGGTVTPGDAQ